MNNSKKVLVKISTLGPVIFMQEVLVRIGILKIEQAWITVFENHI